MDRFECINGDILCKFCNKRLHYTNDICTNCQFIFQNGLKHSQLDLTDRNFYRNHNIYLDSYLEQNHIYSICFKCKKYKIFSSHNLCSYYIINANKIKIWYKRRRYNKSLYNLLEWIESIRMDPKSKYFQNIMNKFYLE